MSKDLKERLTQQIKDAGAGSRLAASNLNGGFVRMIGLTLYHDITIQEEDLDHLRATRGLLRAAMMDLEAFLILYTSITDKETTK